MTHGCGPSGPVQTAWAAVGADAGRCVAVGRATRVADRAAAFHNGVAGHSSLLEDCGPGGLREGSHPGTYVVPAALVAWLVVERNRLVLEAEALRCEVERLRAPSVRCQVSTPPYGSDT